jgi:hypothetical protein
MGDAMADQMEKWSSLIAVDRWVDLTPPNLFTS